MVWSIWVGVIKHSLWCYYLYHRSLEPFHLSKLSLGTYKIWVEFSILRTTFYEWWFLVSQKRRSPTEIFLCYWIISATITISRFFKLWNVSAFSSLFSLNTLTLFIFNTLCLPIYLSWTLRLSLSLVCLLWIKLLRIYTGIQIQVQFPIFAILGLEFPDVELLGYMGNFILCYFFHGDKPGSSQGLPLALCSGSLLEVLRRPLCRAKDWTWVAHAR